MRIQEQMLKLRHFRDKYVECIYIQFGSTDDMTRFQRSLANVDRIVSDRVTNYVSAGASKNMTTGAKICVNKMKMINEKQVGVRKTAWFPFKLLN